MSHRGATAYDICEHCLGDGEVCELCMYAKMICQCEEPQLINCDPCNGQGVRDDEDGAEVVDG